MTTPKNQQPNNSTPTMTQQINKKQQRRAHSTWGFSRTHGPITTGSCRPPSTTLRRAQRCYTSGDMECTHCKCGYSIRRRSALGSNRTGSPTGYRNSLSLQEYWLNGLITKARNNPLLDKKKVADLRRKIHVEVEKDKG